MNQMKDNINFLQKFVKNRETYISFSPLGTAIMWAMYVIYYFLPKGGIWNISDDSLFMIIGIAGIIIVSILSIVGSKDKWEQLLPSSIKHILVNLLFIVLTYFIIIRSIPNIVFDHVVGISFLLYGLLIIVSRVNIPECIKYLGIAVFISGWLLLWPLGYYTNEIILIVLWWGHIITSVLLKINNDKNV